MNSLAIKRALKITLPYLLVSGVYIIFSDSIVKNISFNQTILTQIQTYKGWGFIVLSSIMLFVLLARYFKQLEQEKINLKASEEKWRTVVTNSPDYIALVDGAGKFLFVNKYPKGFSPEKVIGDDCINYYADEHKDLFKQAFKKCLETKKIQHFEIKAFGDNHSIKYYDQHIIPLKAENNEITLLVVARDTTERKEFDIAIKESEEKYRSLFENMNEGFAYCRMIYENEKPVDFVYLSTNPKFNYLTGLKDVEGKRVSEVIPGIQKDNPELFDIYGRVSLGGAPESFETFVPSLNDWFSISVYSPRTHHFVAVFNIITEKKQTELSLQKNERFLADIIENSGALIYVKDLEGRYELINKKWEEVTGLDRLEVLGKTDKELFSGYDGDQFRDNDLNVIQQKQVIVTEETLESSKGKEYFISIKFPTLDEFGAVNGICGMSTDVKGRKIAEEALKESELKYKRIAENIKDVVWILDINLEKFIYVSPSVYSLRGYTPEEIMDRPVFEALTPESANLVKDMTSIRLSEFLSTNESKYYIDLVEQPCKDGSTVWTEVITSFYLNTKTSHIEVRGVTRDISERRKAEEALKSSEERFRTTLDSMLEGCQIIDSEWRYVYINDAAEKHSRMKKSELLGKKYTDIWPGSENESLFRIMKDCMESGRAHQFENEFKFQDGKVGWFDLSIQPVPEGIFILSIDITEKKKVDLEILRSREQLRALAASLEKVREEERIHLSRELHDHLGQNLTGLKMDVAYLAKHLLSDTTFDENMVLEKTNTMSDLIDDLIKNVRKISSELRPNVLDYLGLIPAIEWYIEDFKKRTEIDYSYNSNTSKIDFGTQVNSSIFRIVQESFTNIIRHSNATKVDLSIIEQPDSIKIIIADNGQGIKQTDLSDVKSLGILGMKERTLHFKGNLAIQNIVTGGTLLTLTIPKDI